ncbi:GMC family oxidoreductase [Nocardia stercoris]|uniref:Cholesterol oxidase n=1 Tax=Nocardia stercoris TaxID=2483361 RepID=A0A3M2L6Q8_9NOCA|nr:GMC family oxidoreductase [Nocardia stercoris]
MGGALLGAAWASGAGRARAEAGERIENLIIGSGYAGSVAALRLAQAGRAGVVLERGRRWNIGPAGNTFATPEKPDPRAVWLPGADGTPLSTGVLEAFPCNGIIGLAGAGVGGGSLVNNAVLIAPSEAGFQRTFAGILDYAEFRDTWYPRARALLGVASIPDDVLGSAAYGNAREFADTVADAGYDPVRLDTGVAWDVVRQEIDGTLAPAAIAGHSLWGINSGAKRSVDRTVLAAAEATGLVEVRPLSPVRSIQATGDGYRVEYTDLAGGEARSVTATRVILAAGSIGTSGLLARAQAEGTLPGITAEVGRRWGTGGDHLVGIGGWPLPSDAQGGPSHLGLFDEAGDVPVTLLSFPLGKTMGGQLAGGLLAVSDPPALGTVRYAGRTVIDWPASDSAVARIAGAVAATAQRIAGARGTTSFSASGAPTTSHSLGGVVFGSATTDTGEVIGCPGLYVVDSALLPGSCGAAPPALTVTALADRCVTTLLAHLDR